MNMKRQIVSLVAALAFITSMTANAQTNPAPFIKGQFEIDFQTRVSMDANGKPQPGVTDTFKVVSLNVADSSLFTGNIIYTPTIFSSLLGREQQSGSIVYDLTASVVNPKNPAQTKAVGRLIGTVPIDKNGVYRFGNGTLRMGVDATGRAKGFESKFLGTAAGRPPKDDSVVGKKTKDLIRLTKEVQGKKVVIVVKDYDKMAFNGLVMAAGPVETYPNVLVNGEMLYDYERLAWYFQNVALSYTIDGKTVSDKLTGNIRWVQSPQYKSNGEGQYEFDVRVNEPEKKSAEADVFAAPSDEAAFFESDNTIACLIGTMKYKDSLSGDSVTRSAVTIDLQGNKLSKLQVINLCKLIMLTCVVPINTD